jgi:hypothetical protein
MSGLAMLMQWLDLYQLGPMIGTPWTMVDKIMKSFFVVMLTIGKVFIQCTWVFGVVHLEDMCNPLASYVYISIMLGMKSSGFGYLGVHHGPNVRQEDT